MALCGSKTRSGEPCKRHAVPGSKRCKLHGGAAAKANKGNQHAAKPGSIYSKYLTEAEQADFDAVELHQIDHELRLTKVLLSRVLNSQAEGYDLLADRYLARIESLTRTREDLEGKRLANDRLRRELGEGMTQTAVRFSRDA